MVLANRLSEIPDFRVLVIEAGPEPTVVINYESPGGNQFLGGTAIDWNFYTTPQEHLDDRVIFYRRKLLACQTSELHADQHRRKGPWRQLRNQWAVLRPRQCKCIRPMGRARQPRMGMG